MSERTVAEVDRLRALDRQLACLKIASETVRAALVEDIDELAEKLMDSVSDRLKVETDALAQRRRADELEANLASLNEKLGPIVRAWVEVVAPAIRNGEEGCEGNLVVFDHATSDVIRAALAVTP